MDWKEAVRNSGLGRLRPEQGEELIRKRDGENPPAPELETLRKESEE